MLEWKTEPRLRRNFQLYITQDPNFAKLCDRREDGMGLEQFWIALALDPPPPQRWEPPDRQQLAFQHLASYYEPICHKAARAIVDTHSQILWEDAFTIARLWLQKQDKLAEVLRKYQPNGPAQFSTYLQSVLMRTIKSETDVGRYSYWRLLCKAPDYEIAQALESVYLGTDQIPQLLLARKYFKKVYIANRINGGDRRKGEIWPTPQGEDFAETANFYNAQRLLRSALPEVAANPPSNGEQIESWMHCCLKALKDKREREHNRSSIEELQQQQGLEIPDPNPESEEAILEEGFEEDCPDSPQSQIHRIHKLFETELRGCSSILEIQLGDRPVLIDPDRILLLKYGIGLTQNQIGELLRLHQSSVNRKLKTYKARLLSALTQLSQPEARSMESVQGWLQKNFLSPNRRDLIAQALVEAIKTLKFEDRELLSLRYGQKVTVEQIGDRLALPLDQVQFNLSHIESQLHKYLFTTLKNWIKQYVDKWLYDFYKTALNHTLNQGFNLLSPDIQKNLEFYYTYRVSLETMTEGVGRDEQRVHDLFWEGICQLETYLLQELSEVIKLPLGTRIERQKITQLIEDWLKNLERSD
ncbi:hypothetical protein NG796_02835 [Laspinema sp. A4]|uniref:sigma factor-like helix-turn-helix DNA-binding protein n=1 Tax=Laspinema sp. D2d TaxID=2953686 RepID=UPI0021BA780B|nr:hypothetical protein [Laspinema sp. D2d]MCT7982223.1 hypothetical protein [Laspinema sp. D2d]